MCYLNSQLFGIPQRPPCQGWLPFCLLPLQCLQFLIIVHWIFLPRRAAGLSSSAHLEQNSYFMEKYHKIWFYYIFRDDFSQRSVFFQAPHLHGSLSRPWFSYSHICVYHIYI